MLLRPLVISLAALLPCLQVHAAEEGAKPVTINVGGAAAAPQATGSATASASLRSQASYFVGLQMAAAVKQNDFDVDEVVRAIREEVAGTAVKPERDEMFKVFQAYQAEQKTHAGAKNSGLLAEKAKAEGAKTTASGLIYTVIQASTKADAKTPAATDKVKVNYVGKFPDGREFDASEKHGGPATFQVNQVVKGWTEALQLMKEGDKLHLVIPPELGYGEQGTGPIPGNQVLEFDVELVEVLPGGAPEAPAMK